MNQIIKQEYIDSDEKSLSMNGQGSPDYLLALAVEKGASIDQLERLMDLKERFDQSNAKKSYYAALSKFQSIVPTIKKTSRVVYSKTNYMFASLGLIAGQIREAMKKCDLSYRFEQNHNKGIEVTCIVTHIGGHSEKTTMLAHADASGSKNPIQAIGSTVTYLQRYTLISALGLTTAEDDIDAESPIETERKGDEFCDQALFDEKYIGWKERVTTGQNKAMTIITQLSNNYKFTREQMARLLDLKSMEPEAKKDA